MFGVVGTRYVGICEAYPCCSGVVPTGWICRRTYPSVQRDPDSGLVLAARPVEGFELEFGIVLRRDKIRKTNTTIKIQR